MFDLLMKGKIGKTWASFVKPARKSYDTRISLKLSTKLFGFLRREKASRSDLREGVLNKPAPKPSPRNSHLNLRKAT